MKRFAAILLLVLGVWAGEQNSFGTSLWPLRVLRSSTVLPRLLRSASLLPAVRVWLWLRLRLCPVPGLLSGAGGRIRLRLPDRVLLRLSGLLVLWRTPYGYYGW